jgi:hypothetical protein
MTVSANRASGSVVDDKLFLLRDQPSTEVIGRQPFASPPRVGGKFYAMASQKLRIR